ncbi:hypothetical protein I350_05336 [Cryptococcus amylolentus CBS 6273]|uniref:Wax synthase domain-containing protein n=1 Tax=Cryptococcus amylolentus CBS 6273 TaxID=1296118 RepID=A0A1E3JVE4_9TREE|nr:hypothetical protein I350_05336 [Cryptococcus amylolentus CBS 6273]
MPILPSSTAPFGFLEPLHAYVLAHSEPLTWSNWWRLAVLPTIPLFLQAVLLRKEGTRKDRLALAVVGIALLWHACLRYRFEQPWFNALNNGISIGCMTLTVRYLEFALIKGRLIDQYWEDKGQHWLVSAFDVCTNARWIGLDPVEPRSNGIEKGGKRPKADKDVSVGTEVRPGHKAISPARNYPPWVVVPNSPLSRSHATIRHLTIAFRNYVISDILLSLLRSFGADSIGSSTPVPGALHRFSSDNTFVLFPKLGNGLESPWWLTEMAAVIAVALCVWLGLSMGYHAIAGVMVGTGLHEVEAWEIDLFDHPLKADSLLDFWGHRWHQFFRHSFTLVATQTLRFLHLPVTSTYVLGLSFFFSGAMHALGQFTMDPVPALFPIFVLFPISGLGCALEVRFKRWTGKKVGGFWGRLWTWSVMLITGRWAAIAWFESGVGGSYLCPAWAGDLLKPFILEWILNRK